jgi:hypothetical protein
VIIEPTASSVLFELPGARAKPSREEDIKVNRKEMGFDEAR